MKKVIYLLWCFCIFLCVGCSDIKYSLKLEDEILENINVTDKQHLNQNWPDNYMPDLSPFEYLFQSRPYDSGSDSKGNYYATRKYNSIEDLVDASIVFEQYISSDYVSINGKKVKINILGHELSSNLHNQVESLEIKLEIPYYVSNHNANSVNNNTYTWNFDNIENAKLKIEFDMSKSYKYKKTLTTIIVVSIFCVIIVGIIIYFLNQNKKANEI